MMDRRFDRFAGTVLAVSLAGLLLLHGCAVGVAPGVDDGGTDGPGSNVNDNNDGGGTGATSVFAVVGDYGDDDDNSRDVADLIKTWDPDFIVTTGDNDYSDGAYKGTFEGLELAVGQYYHEFIGNYMGESGPGASVNAFFPTPGDHDWGDTCDDPTGLDDYLAYFTLPDEGSGNERYYDFRRGPIHFFSIHAIEDCEPDGASADSVQAEWVRDTATASDATFLVAYFHKPPYSSGARHIGEGEHMRWPWAQWGFDLVMSGDDHIYERIERDGIVYVVNGLGGVDIHEFVETPVQGSLVRYNDTYGAMRVEVTDSRLTASFISVDGETIDTFSISAPEP